MLRSELFAFLVVLFLFCVGTSWSIRPDEDPVKVQLISEVKSIQPGIPFWVALRLQMDEQWHTYWKNPGDSGLPTTMEWNLPEGFKAGEIQWPYPQKIETSPFVTFGYEGEIFLLTEIKTPESINVGAVVKLKACVEWLMCKESCIPGSAELALELPVKSENPKADKLWASSFTKTRTRIPRVIPGWKINTSISESRIVIQAVPPSGLIRDFESVVFFPEQAGLVKYAESVSFRKTDIGYFLGIPRSRLIKKTPERLKGVLYTPEGWNESRDVKAMSFEVPLHRIK
jgi:thiol:disulfide interchange protein DsbD